MSHRPKSILDSKKRYLQVALNSTLEDAREIIGLLPISDRIIVEAGTPLIKRYGADGIRQIRRWYAERLLGRTFAPPAFPQNPNIAEIFKFIGRAQANDSENERNNEKTILPYVVADLKTMDRGETEVEMAAEAGASAAIALGSAPVETINSFIASCEAHGLDAMVDMMHVEFPLSVLRALKKVPQVVIIHRGVDEERFNREKTNSLTRNTAHQGSVRHHDLDCGRRYASRGPTLDFQRRGHRRYLEIGFPKNRRNR